MSGKKFYAFLSASALALVITVIGCKKGTTDEDYKVEDISYGKENARIEQVASDAQTFIDQAFASGFLNLKGGNVLGSGCATLSVDTAAKQIAIDFGGVDCRCKDSRLRRGRILSSYSKNYTDSGSVRLISFSDYYVNDYKVEGTIVVTVRKDPNAVVYYELTNDLKLTSKDGAVTSRTYKGKRTYVTGAWSADVYDDIYYMDGYGVYTHSNGGIYNFNSEQHIRIDPNCDWPQEGVVEMTQLNGIARVLDYGPAIGCDHKATLTVDRVVNEVILD